MATFVDSLLSVLLVECLGGGLLNLAFLVIVSS